MKQNTKEELTKKCFECGAVMRGAVGNYRYTECGLNSVNLVGVVVYHCKCGAIVPQIPAMGELHRRIAFSLIEKETLLSGQEIRFLRKMAGLRGVEMSQLLGTHKTSLSKWENGKLQISKKADATLRLLSFTAMLQQLVKQRDEDDKKLVPLLAAALKQMSSVDIKGILRKVRDVETGPKKVNIDPQELAKFGMLDHQQSKEIVQ